MSDADDFMTRYLNNIISQYESSRSKPEYEPAEPETIKVTCRDGVEPTIDTFRLATPGPYPTIVVRCPRPQQVELWKLHGEHLNRCGYAMACEWCHGTYTSGGTWEPDINECSDGAGLLAWCEHQDWIDVIGLWGTSYLSLTCWTVADITILKVASIYASHYGTDRLASAYQKGSFRCDVSTARAMQNAGYSVDADHMKSALHLPQISADEDMWGDHLDWRRDWISHPKGADAYWDERFWGLLKPIPSKVKVPMFIHEGWFGRHLDSVLTGYAALNGQVKEHSWLHIGYWSHYFLNPLEGLEPKHFDAAEVPTALEWFDLTLKRKQTPMRRVEYYEIGSDSWHVADSWPLPSAGADEVRLYLKSGELTAEAPQAANAAEYDYDPADPVMTRGGETLLTTMDEIDAHIQPEPGWRGDVITSESESLDHDLHTQGTISVDLYVSSNVPDIAFMAKLMCVDPDDTTRNHRTSITTIGLDTSDTTPYKPGEIHRVNIDIWGICWMMPTGSRIRCDISSSDFPQYSVHTDHARLWSEQTGTQVAHQTIHMGGATPSVIALPVRG